MEKVFQHTKYPSKKVEKQKSHNSAVSVQIQVPKSLTKDKGLVRFGVPISRMSSVGKVPVVGGPDSKYLGFAETRLVSALTPQLPLW